MLNPKVVKFSVIIKLYKVTKKLQFDETDIQSLKKKSKNCLTLVHNLSQ